MGYFDRIKNQRFFEKSKSIYFNWWILIFRCVLCAVSIDLLLLNLAKSNTVLKNAVSSDLNEHRCANVFSSTKPLAYVTKMAPRRFCWQASFVIQVHRIKEIDTVLKNERFGYVFLLLFDEHVYRWDGPFIQDEP